MHHGGHVGGQLAEAPAAEAELWSLDVAGDRNEPLVPAADLAERRGKAGSQPLIRRLVVRGSNERVDAAIVSLQVPGEQLHFPGSRSRPW